MRVVPQGFLGSAAAAPSAAPHLRIILPEETPPESQRLVTHTPVNYAAHIFCIIPPEGHDD